MEDTYSFLRVLSGRWCLVLMMAFFIGAVIFAFRPGSKRVQEESAHAIFRNEDTPAAADEEAERHEGETR